MGLDHVRGVPEKEKKREGTKCKRHGERKKEKKHDQEEG